MAAVAEIDTPVSPLLAAGEHLRALDLPRPTVAQVPAATGANTRSPHCHRQMPLLSGSSFDER